MPFDKTLNSSADYDIINNLLQQGTDRKKGEDLLFTRYAYFIQQAMTKYSFDEEEAFNIYSDTILSAIPKITNGSFEGRSTLKTWLYQIFHNKCVDFIRKKTTNKSSVHRNTSVPEHAAACCGFSQRQSCRRLWNVLIGKWLRKKLSELGENCRKLLVAMG